MFPQSFYPMDSVGQPGLHVIPRSPSAGGRRGISHCSENTQSEIPRSAPDHQVRGSARNDSPKEVFTQTRMVAMS